MDASPRPARSRLRMEHDCSSCGDRRDLGRAFEAIRPPHVSAMSHSLLMNSLPRFPLRGLDELLACAEEIHSDRCQWMGHDSSRPCTCGVPSALKELAQASTQNSDAGGKATLRIVGG